MPYKTKHEERTQRNAELDEFYCKTVAPVHPMVVGRSDALALVQN